LTRDPLLVSLVSFAEWLPWLLFGLLSMKRGGRSRPGLGEDVGGSQRGP
jgi:hypothetical protein